MIGTGHHHDSRCTDAATLKLKYHLQQDTRSFQLSRLSPISTRGIYNTPCPYLVIYESLSLFVCFFIPFSIYFFTLSIFIFYILYLYISILLYIPRSPAIPLSLLLTPDHPLS
jgi:hypothetical protein